MGSSDWGLPQDLAHTLRTRLVDRPRFSAPKRPPHAFGIEHYAGHVVYSTTSLMDKNKDFTVAEQQQLMASSDSPFIRYIAPSALLPSAITAYSRLRTRCLQQTGRHRALLCCPTKQRM